MKKSLISIAAIGILSIPALASSTIAQTEKVIGPVLSAELTRLEGIISQRQLVEDDFIDVLPLIQVWVDKLNVLDPKGIVEHAVVTQQIENLQAIGIDQKYKIIIDDFRDFRQSMIATALNARIRAWAAAALLNKPASVQPVLDAITERLQNALPTDPRKVADSTSATEIAQELAKRVQGVPAAATDQDFKFFVEVITGQRLRQYVRITMARRQISGLVNPVDFKHVRSLITVRHQAELQLYRDAAKETQSLNTTTTELETAAKAAGAQPAPFVYLAAVSADLDLRRSIKFMQRKAMGGNQTATQFNRLRDLLLIRATGPTGRSNLGRALSTEILAETTKLEQLSAKRVLVKEDFVTMDRLRNQLLTRASNATLKK